MMYSEISAPKFLALKLLVFYKNYDCIMKIKNATSHLSHLPLIIAMVECARFEENRVRYSQIKATKSY